jgi:hypothetical protein
MRLRHSFGIIPISLNKLLAPGHEQHGSSSPQRYEGRDSFGIDFVSPKTLSNRLQSASRSMPITELEKSPQEFQLDSPGWLSEGTHSDGNNRYKSSPSRRTAQRSFKSRPSHSEPGTASAAEFKLYGP